MEYIVCFHTKFSTASIQFRRLDYSLDNFYMYTVCAEKQSTDHI